MLYSFMNLTMIPQENVSILSNYSGRAPDYPGIIPDLFYHPLFKKLFHHNVCMPTTTSVKLCLAESHVGC